jgi:hypothetical protein
MFILPKLRSSKGNKEHPSALVNKSADMTGFKAM